MKNKVLGICAGVAVLLGMVGLSPKMVNAQQKKLHVIVVRDVMHVISPKVGGMKPVPPALGVRQQFPLRHAMPVSSNVQAPTQDPVLQQSAGSLVSTTNGISFQGVGVGFAGATSDHYAPPDTNGAAGSTQYVQWVNVSFAVFNKSTGATEAGPVSGNTLWQSLGGACASNNSGDPIAEYDKQAQRWVLMQPVFTSPYDLCVAVSTTSDATGTYNLYQFPIPGSGFPDYPKLAVWPDGYYVSFNDFGTNGNSFQGGYACAMDRASMLAGNSATMQCINSGYPSLLPSDLDGDSGAPGTTLAPPAGSPDYFIDFSSTSSLNLWKFHVDWSNPSNSTLTGPTAIPVASFSEACGGGTCIPQPGTNEQLDSLADRLMYRFAYRNFGSYESLVVSQSVDTGNGNTGVRWYEIRSPGSNPTVYQQGTFAPDSNDRWMPSIAEDEKGDIALGYSEASSGLYPQIDYTGRLASDSPGTMESESTIQSGGGSQQTNLSRWGDYSSMSVDPSDDCTFWYTTEYLQSSGTFNWSTRIASFSFPGCTGPATPDYSLSGSPSSQTVVQGNNTSYTITATPLNGYTGDVQLSATGQPSDATVTFTPTSDNITGSSAVSSTMQVTTTASTTPGTYTITVQGTDGTLTHTTTVTLVVQSAPKPDFAMSGSPGSQTVVQGNNTSYTITVTPSNGYTGNVQLSATGQPSDATVTFTPTSDNITGSSAVSSTMQVTTTASTTPGTYTITVQGTDGTLTHTTTVTLVVQVPSSSDFTISATPLTAAAAPGSSTSYTVMIAGSGTGPYNGTVSLSVSGVPSRTGSSWSTTSITGSGSATLTLSPNRKAALGTYSLTITGTSGSLSHRANVTFVVGTLSTPNFSLSGSPTSQSVVQGTASASYSITVSGTGGFTGDVSLTENGLPVTPTFNPTTVTGGSGSSTLTVPTSGLAVGTYSFTVTGTSGSLVQNLSLTLDVQQAGGGSGDFSIGITPSSQTVGPKSSTSYTVTVSAQSGFTGTVSLSVAGLPNRTSSSFSSSTITGSGFSTLTISTTPKSAAGTYPLTITGTSGSLTHSVPATLIIN